MAEPGDGVGVSQRVQRTTISRWNKKLNNEITQEYALLAEMEKRKQIKYINDGGGQFRWGFHARDVPLGHYVDGTAKSFQRNDLEEVAKLGWRTYDASEIITSLEKAQHKGGHAMIDVFSERSPRIRKGLKRRLAGQFFVDGEAAGFTEGWHGIESFMGIGPQTVGDELQTSSTDTYGGLPTSFTGLSGGSIDLSEGYKCFTPVIVNCNRDTGGGPVLWDAAGDEYLRVAISEASYGPGDKLDLILLRKLAMRQLKNILDDKEQVYTDRGQGHPSEVAFGFQKIWYDGVALMEDVGIPALDPAGRVIHGYGFDMSKIYLKVLNAKPKTTIFSVDVDWSIDYQADKIYWCSFSNLCFDSPRHFAKFANLG